jgi:hypothetical protein
MSKPSNKIADQLNGEESKLNVEAEQSQRATIERIKAELMQGVRNPLDLNTPEGQLAEAEVFAQMKTDFFSSMENGQRVRPVVFTTAIGNHADIPQNDDPQIPARIARVQPGRDLRDYDLENGQKVVIQHIGGLVERSPDAPPLSNRKPKKKGICVIL